MENGALTQTTGHLSFSIGTYPVPWKTALRIRDLSHKRIEVEGMEEQVLGTGQTRSLKSITVMVLQDQQDSKPQR